MPATNSTSDPGLERANEMYWNSDRRVDDIVRELKVGRSAFYSSIQPMPAGRSCQACGDPLVFTNRTNRDAGAATCLACGSEAQLSRSEPAASPIGMPDRERDAEGAASDPPHPWTRWRDDLAAVSPQRAAMVGGAAALGLVFGAAAARMIQEMK